MHLHVKVLKRSAGDNAVKKAAYNSRSNLQDLTTGKRYYHRSKGGLVAEGILIPNRSPKWLRDITSNREVFWTEVEQCEIRRDAQLAREITFSLPYELSNEQNATMLKSFVQEEFVNLGIVADFVIHNPPAGGDQRNIHGHVMLSMREIGSDGFGLKVRDWNNRNIVKTMRERWAAQVNKTLERYGFEGRFDHRSHKERGVVSKPQKYLGRTYKKRKVNSQLPLDITKILHDIIGDSKDTSRSNELERD